MAEQRWGGDLRVYGALHVETQGDAGNSVVTRALLDQLAATYRDRATHTGTQTFDTISDGRAYVDGRVQAVVGAAPAALDTLQEIAARLASDSDAAGALTATVTDNRTRIDALSSDLVTLDTAFGTLTARVDEHTGQLTDLRADLTTTTATATGAAAEAAALRTDVTALRGDVDELTGTTGGLASQTDLAALTTTVGALDTRVDGIDTTTAGLRTDVDAAAAAAAAAQTTADAAAPAATVTALTARVDTLESDTAGADALTALTARVDTVEDVAAAAATTATVTALDARVDTVEGDVAGVEAATTALDARLDTLERVTVHKRTVGNGAVSTFTIAHGLDSTDVDVIVRDLTDGQRIYPVDTVVDANTVALDFGTFVPPANTARVIVKAL